MPTDSARAPESRSHPLVYAGAGGLGLAFFIAERLLANDGQIAATMLSRLSPLMGPVWASWPVLAILLGFTFWFAVKWARAQTAAAAANTARLEAEQAAAAAAADLSVKVGAVATGLDGLRSEVHELRGALQDHADATDLRLRTHDEGLRAVQADVSVIARRVDVLEKPQPQPPRKRPSAKTRG